MNDISTQISRFYRESFTLEKLRTDLFAHLNADVNGCYIKTDSGYELDLYI